MTFPELDSTLRTDQSVREKRDEGFHRADCNTPLAMLDMGLVSNVPLDYMHLVCLGVFKRMLNFWTKGRKDLRMTDHNIEYVNSELMNLKKYIPKEFSRLPRSLKDVDRFKATEYRQLLLYTGPMIFKNKINNNMYLHFLTLHCAIRILCCNHLLEKYLNYAKDLLHYFVKNFSVIYGPEFITHNVHNLIHLADDCKIHGPLDTFSAFKYENFLYKLKKSVKFSRFPLQQAVSKYNSSLLLEPENLLSWPNVKNEICIPTEIINCHIHATYKNLCCPNFEIVNNFKDSCIVTIDGLFIDIKFICKKASNQEIVLFGFQYSHTKYFYSEPCNSADVFNIVIDKNKLDKLIEISLKSIAFKCFRYPLSKDSDLIIPLLHNENY